MKELLHVPCGKCYACRMNRRMSWTYRLMQELRFSYTAYFLTLTYSDEFLPDKGVLIKSHLQDYIKKLRNYGKLRYFGVGEYGGRNKRPHYHLLLFNFEHPDALGKCWNYGFVGVGSVSQASIHYCSKDMMKDKTKKSVNGVSGFTIMSLKPAIGFKALDLLEGHRARADFTVMCGKVKMAMPRFYRDRLFDDDCIDEKLEYQKKVQEFTDKKFKEFKERFEKKSKANFFKFLLQEEEALLRIEEKKLKLNLNNKL